MANSTHQVHKRARIVYNVTHARDYIGLLSSPETGLIRINSTIEYNVPDI